ncbi:FAD-binding oxidoreductase [Roseovarius aestuarii]|nr:FAD-binding oxidoreductase [Roseovarius aestuarii]
MADVTVRGAGIFGLSIAWACVTRGARVQVIDPHGAAAGASGGIVGALAPHVPENWNDKKAFQLDSLLMAEGFWHEVVDVSGVDPGYARLGRVQPLADGGAITLAESRAKGAQALWQGRADWQVVDAGAMPLAPLSGSGRVVLDTLSARIHPRQACAALASALTEKGVEILPDGPDQGAVLWATGAAGLAAFNEGHSRQVGAGIKGQAALLAFDARDQPQVFAGGVHIVPHGDGTTAVGSTSERDYNDPFSTDAQLDDVVAAARAAVPALKDAPVIERWAGLRPRARSRAPMLGKHPQFKGQFVANGGFKIGFGMAPKVAQVMADLMLEGHGDIPSGFLPEASF